MSLNHRHHLYTQLCKQKVCSINRMCIWNTFSARLFIEADALLKPKKLPLHSENINIFDWSGSWGGPQGCCLFQLADFVWLLLLISDLCCNSVFGNDWQFKMGLLLRAKVKVFFICFWWLWLTYWIEIYVFILDSPISVSSKVLLQFFILFWEVLSSFQAVILDKNTRINLHFGGCCSLRLCWIQ